MFKIRAGLIKNDSKRDLNLVTKYLDVVVAMVLVHQLVNKLVLNNSIFYHKNKKAGPKPCLLF